MRDSDLGRGWNGRIVCVFVLDCGPFLAPEGKVSILLWLRNVFYLTSVATIIVLIAAVILELLLVLHFLSSIDIALGKDRVASGVGISICSSVTAL